MSNIDQLGFDADMLEVLFHELNDVVDKFFVVESTRTHNKGIHKALLWDRLKDQPRFKMLQNKVVHLVLDDTEAFMDPKQIFAIEGLQEKMRWESFVRWNDHTHLFGPDDVLGFGDVDEMPSRENVNLLRHCEFAGPSVDIGSWFAWGRLDLAFRPDWPVHGHPWTLGDPTYWTLAAATELAKDGIEYPNRKRGYSDHYLLGGIHMTDNAYLPFILAKLIACTECGNELERLLQQLAGYFRKDDRSTDSMVALGEQFDSSTPSDSRFQKVVNVRADLGAAYYVPWFMQCNVHRYASWYGELDSR